VGYIKRTVRCILPVVRKTVLTDIARVMEIEERSHKTPWNILWHKRAIKQDNLFSIVTECDAGDVTGYCVCSDKTPAMVVENIAAFPIRLGYGRSLLNALKRMTSYGGHYESIITEVSESNKAAIAFFVAHGFQKRGVVEKPHGNPENSVSLEWKRYGGSTV
jgi:ribosomal protein S18 acetylase RimI-like enzyme